MGLCLGVDGSGGCVGVMMVVGAVIVVGFVLGC